jgi:hypothetical protein
VPNVKTVGDGQTVV